MFGRIRFLNGEKYPSFTLEGTDGKQYHQNQFKDKEFGSYGIEGGPLDGLIGTVDARLQTITLLECIFHILDLYLTFYMGVL